MCPSSFLRAWCMALLLLLPLLPFFSSSSFSISQSISASRSFSLKGQSRTCMAVSLLCNEVSDLCIGKPPLRSLPATATVGEALVALKLCGDTFVSVAAAPTSRAKAKAAPPPGIGGKICVADVLCFLCLEGNVSAPAAALKSPVTALLAKGEGSVRKVATNSSILEALDVLLESSAQTLVVPICPSYTKKKLNNQEFCWLTQEDLVRFFLNNIFLFSSIAPLSVTDLGLVRPATLTVRYHDSATSALICSALHENTSVAVVTDDGKLIGEISPFTLSTCDETVAAAIASLSAGELMSYIDCCNCGGAPDSVVQAVKTRLKDKELNGMLEFLEDEELLLMLSLSSLSCSASSASSSSDEEGEIAAKKRRPRRMRSGSYSARMGRRSEEAIVCHPESSLVAVMVQALAHRVSYVWVVDEEDYGLVGIVTFQDVLRVFREQLQ